MKKCLFTSFLLLQLFVYSQQVPNFDYQYSSSDTINGQIETANRLYYFMNLEQFDSAIQLFSQRQQDKILRIKSDEEQFLIWCNAWKTSERDLERYISRIQRRKGSFIYEDNKWRIDEN